MALDLLKEELLTYTRHLERLLSDSEGKWVLIHESRIVGVYDTDLDASSDGYRRCGNVAFLVKRIARVEEPETYMTDLPGA